METSQDPARSEGRRWRTWANALTAVRLAAALPCFYAIIEGLDELACLLFCLAAATDLADGRVARWLGESNPFGGLIDHATDAIFVSSALAALAYHGVIPSLLPGLVVLAFLQYTFDSKALAGHALRSSAIGQWNGIAYFGAAGLGILDHATGLGPLPTGTPWALGWVLVGTTILSMLDRAWTLARRPADSP